MARYTIPALGGKSNRGKRVSYKPRTLAARRIQRAFRKRRPQARFAASRSQYVINKMVSKAASRMSETKLVSLTSINPGAANGEPSNILGTGSNPRVYSWRGILDTVPTSWDSGLIPLQGFSTIQGDAANQHVGNYVYYKKTSINLQLDMVYNVNSVRQIQFRMLVAKARQLATPAGQQDLPQTTLFLNQIGNRQGVDSVSSLAMTPFEVMNNPINKRNWVVLRDSKFFMNSPASMDQGKYPSRRNFRITLPHYKKTKITTSGQALDYDPKYIIYIFATVPGALTNTQLPDSFRVAARGTTSYNDN